MSTFDSFVTGAISLAGFVAALFFVRFWRSTRDPFFLWFSLSFALEAGNRAASAFVELGDDNPVLYGLRIIAYGLILVAIWQKNRR